MWTTTLVCVTILATSYARNKDQMGCSSEQLMRLLSPGTFGNWDEPPVCLAEAGGRKNLVGLISEGERILQSNNVVLLNDQHMTENVATVMHFAGRNANFREVLTEGCKMTNAALMCVVKKRNVLKCNITLIEVLGGGLLFDVMSEYNQIEAGGIQPCTDLAKLLMVN